jgi:hypothetical protein
MPKRKVCLCKVSNLNNKCFGQQLVGHSISDAEQEGHGEDLSFAMLTIR